jgi:hypothetical protein
LWAHPPMTTTYCGWAVDGRPALVLM